MSNICKFIESVIPFTLQKLNAPSSVFYHQPFFLPLSFKTFFRHHTLHSDPQNVVAFLLLRRKYCKVSPGH